MRINPLTAIDFYKADHRRQYPKGTTKVYSNFTARSNKHTNCEAEKIVFFGLQYFVKGFLMIDWKREFFDKDKAEVVARYRRRMDTALGKGAIPIEHIEALHDLGYLPIQIKALPEGTQVPMKTPVLTVTNTHPDFFWLVNYIETVMSAFLWKPCTSATTAFQFRKLFNEYYEKTSDLAWFPSIQGHDFSFRGMAGINDAVMSGAAHLLSFTGTDTVPAIDFLETYYDANADEEMIGGSVPATEHSVMCMGGKESELETFERLITELYPTGIVSIVSDTWDFWKVITETVVTLKDKIMARDGKVVIRPDSGNPTQILCGTAAKLPADIILDGDILDFLSAKKQEGYSHVMVQDSYYKIHIDYDNGEELPSIGEEIPRTEVTPEMKGAVQCLWETFGGHINEKGFKQLHSSIGLIYGDSISYKKAKEILQGLEAKGFASTNVVMGIGSYTYEYVTRDTYGFAVKATYGEINGQPVEIFKDPKTDNGEKKSAKGLIRVNEDLTYTDCVTPDEEEKGLLHLVFKDGIRYNNQSLVQIRKRLGV